MTYARNTSARTSSGSSAGKYYERVKANSNVVVLDPEVAAVFTNSDAVNRALHSLIEVAEKISGQGAGNSK